jgi:hypothetical protein
MFQKWLVDKNEVLTNNNVEVLLWDFGDHLLEEGEPMHRFEKVVAAVVYRTAGLQKKDMKRIAMALKGFRKARPASSRPPIPDELAAAITAAQMAQGHHISALLTWTAQRCYFRPGERHKILVKDLLPPANSAAAGGNWWSIQIAPQERLQPSKTQTFDDTILLDASPGLGPLLGQLAQHRAPDAVLFQISPDEVRQHWMQAVEVLGFKGLVQYQLRHGGASSDLLSQRRPLSEILARMRVSSLTTLRRYAKPGRLASMLHQMSPAVRLCGNESLLKINRILSRKLMLPLPR